MTTWILLRGLTREAGHWGDFIGTFKARIPDARIVTLDLPGNGALNHLRSPCTVAGMADHCRTTLLQRGIAPPYKLLAMSLGAMVAVAWASTAPREIARCVLINTSLRPFSPFFRRLRPGNYLRLLKIAMPATSCLEREMAILAMTSRMRSDHEHILRIWVALREAHAVTRKNALRQLCAAMRYRAPAEKPDVPLLILASENDTLVHSACSVTLAQKWGTEIHIHPQAGHDIALDDGDWLAAQVARWQQAAQ